MSPALGRPHWIRDGVGNTGDEAGGTVSDTSSRPTAPSVSPSAFVAFSAAEETAQKLANVQAAVVVSLVIVIVSLHAPAGSTRLGGPFHASRLGAVRGVVLYSIVVPPIPMSYAGIRYVAAS